MRAWIGLPMIAIALLLFGSPARAASPGFCYLYAKSLASESQGLIGKGGCGQDTSDSFWSSSTTIQLQWCLGTSEDTVKTRVREMQEVNKKCDYCQGYADTMAAAAEYNITHKCGFTYSGDERWKPDRQFHFIGCMRFEYGSNYDESWIDHVSHSGELSYVKSGLDSILGDVTGKIAQCKAIQKSTSPLAVQVLHERSLRDALERLPRRLKLKTSTTVTPCKPGARAMLSPCNLPTSAVIAPGMLESDQGSTRQGVSATGAPSGGSGAGSPTYSRSGVR